MRAETLILELDEAIALKMNESLTKQTVCLVYSLESKTPF